MRRIKKLFTWKQEGVGVVEIILILVILIGLVFIFKTEIEIIVKDAFTAITGNTKSINGT